MSGKVVQLHQLMEHEALSIETDFTHLKDNDFKSYVVTGESLSSLKTALTRGEKLLLADKPTKPMFIMGFDDVEQSEEDRLKVLIHGLKRMQVRRVNPAVNNDYPKDVIKAIDSRLGTASGGLNIGGMMYDNPSKDTLHPPAEMPERVPEKVINEPVSEPPKSNIAPTFGMAPNRLIFKLVYDDKEQTKAANVPYTVIMEDGKNTQITGTLDKSGKAEVQPDTNHAAYILFGDEALVAEAQKSLDNAYSKLDNAINNKAKQSAQHAFDTLNKQEKVPVTQAFADAVNHKLDELNQQSQAFNNQSFLSQSWDMAKATQSGATSGVTEYLPDLGDFGELLDAADINVTMLIEAIVTGDVDALEDKFQAWKERGKQGMWEACDTMEMLILLLSDSQGRELIASLPARMLAALPRDKVVEMSAYHATQLGMDIAVVSGGTALGAFAGGVGAPIAGASLLLAANGRKAGKVLEETVEVLGEMKDALKVVRNNNTKKQLYKKDHSIPNDQQDLNTRTFVTPLKEKAASKDKEANNDFTSENQSFREKISNLSESDKLLIDDVATFNTLGISNADAHKYVTQSSDGQLMIETLRKSDPSASDAILTSRAIDLVRSGNSLPEAMIIDSPLIKLVPSGGELSGYSPFFTTQNELNAAVKSGRSFTDYFGLPATNDSDRYGVFEIKPHTKATVFSSNVAPTTELGGVFKTNAGGLQIITPQRSEFTDPVFVEVVNNNKGY
ncbi:hypothetical protein [Shewanella surugensis]|uniref:Uncharacterized protein n=1 Tax=Shewanella surugensis TaxID=212020 RepID=A0ABT0L6S7_9GAMM|nr:hypothetical protein [Shewanella surugensis]MCL1123406.1 hypothetical protein [Shewanella surugensis]